MADIYGAVCEICTTVVQLLSTMCSKPIKLLLNSQIIIVDNHFGKKKK